MEHSQSLYCLCSTCCPHYRDRQQVIARKKRDNERAARFDPNEPNFLQLVRLFKKYQVVKYEKIQEVFMYCGKNYELAKSEIADEYNINEGELIDEQVFDEDISIVSASTVPVVRRPSTGNFKTIKKDDKFRAIAHLSKTVTTLTDRDYAALAYLLDMYKKINNIQ